MLETINNCNFYTGIIEGEIQSYCYLVKAGCKPMAVVSVKSIYLEMVKHSIKNDYNLNVYIEDVEDYLEWKTVYIYKYNYLLDIIKQLPAKPQSPYDHWVIGKLCGYSDYEIGEYIRNSKNIT